MTKKLKKKKKKTQTSNYLHEEKMHSLPSNFKIQKNDNGFYLIDLKLKESMHLYYSLKERFEYKIDDREKFINLIAQSIEQFTQSYSHIIIPESSSDFLTLLMQGLQKTYYTIAKNNIQNVIQFSQTLPLQKKERIAHLERLSTMDTVFKINLMKANQRRYYETQIFQPLDVQTDEQSKILVIDDSCFSGTTLNGIKSSLNKDFDFLAIFSK